MTSPNEEEQCNYATDLMPQKGLAYNSQSVYCVTISFPVLDASDRFHIQGYQTPLEVDNSITNIHLAQVAKVMLTDHELEG